MCRAVINELQSCFLSLAHNFSLPWTEAGMIPMSQGQASEAQPICFSRAHFILWTFVAADHIYSGRKSSSKIDQHVGSSPKALVDKFKHFGLFVFLISFVPLKKHGRRWVMELKLCNICILKNTFWNFIAFFNNSNTYCTLEFIWDWSVWATSLLLSKMLECNNMVFIIQAGFLYKGFIPRESSSFPLTEDKSSFMAT